ncbi:DUF6193 family natural product biosynthesis protein [Streptomyces sp. NPDC006326]|uniref:DUF6193 family natural product biosynthesis protein n=1 Tax=Streptomyces sp. NPDC006326 TaxID=3156752 RepID=UPI0033A4A08E
MPLRQRIVPAPAGHGPPAIGQSSDRSRGQKVRGDGRVRPELLEAAYAEPRLRQLFPWTGMGELHYIRCTEQ